MLNARTVKKFAIPPALLAAIGSGLIITGSAGAARASTATHVADVSLSQGCGPNLLTNTNFEAKNALGGFQSITTPAGQPVAFGASAAAGWEQWNDHETVIVGNPGVTEPDTTTSDLLRSTNPSTRGQNMLHMITNGSGSEFNQEWAAPNQGPRQAVFSVWVYLITPTEVGAGVGNGGATAGASQDTTPGRWVLLHGQSPLTGPANEIAVGPTLAQTGGVSEFYMSAPIVKVVCGTPPSSPTS